MNDEMQVRGMRQPSDWPPNLLQRQMPPEGQKRLQHESTDRLDRETAKFHQRVYEGYQAMAVSGILRFKVIDATDSPEEMLDRALGHLKRLDHGLLKYL